MQELLQQVLSRDEKCVAFSLVCRCRRMGRRARGHGYGGVVAQYLRGSARVYVDGTSVLRPLLNDRIVAPDLATHLLYARQALLGREYLERVATDNGLDSATTSVADKEVVLEKLRIGDRHRRDSRGCEQSRNSSSIFTIRYRHRLPEVAVGVVRSLMNFLIEDTLGANREGTDKAARFLDERIAEHEARLEKAEQALAEFQRANSGTLPGTQGSYFERMQTRTGRTRKTRRDLRIAESKRDRLRQQLTSETPLVSDDPA